MQTNTHSSNWGHLDSIEKTFGSVLYNAVVATLFSKWVVFHGFAMLRLISYFSAQ